MTGYQEQPSRPPSCLMNAKPASARFTAVAFSVFLLFHAGACYLLGWVIGTAL